MDDYVAKAGAYAALLRNALELLESCKERDLLTRQETQLAWFIRERFTAIEDGQMHLADITAGADHVRSE